jgi:hypothetical protein
MFFTRLTNVVRNRLISEIRDFLTEHPRYNKVIVTHKYPDIERPKDCVVVTSASADPVILSPSHFISHSVSHVFQARAEGHPGFLLNWIREDANAVQNGNLVPAGFYYLVVNNISTPEDGSGTKVEILVDPLLRIDNEILVQDSNGYRTRFRLVHYPIQENSLEVYDTTVFPKVKLAEEMHYTVDIQSGWVTFSAPVGKEATVEAHYRYAGISVGPVTIRPLSSNNTLIPGVVLAFGEHFLRGDKSVVVVTKSREFAAEIYGGWWNINYGIDVVAQDPIESAKIGDYVLNMLWTVVRDKLAGEAIMISAVNHGGESEGLESETAQVFNHTNSISVGVSVEWEHQVPILKYLRKISLYSPPSSPEMTNEEIAALKSSLVAVERLPEILRDTTCEYIA